MTRADLARERGVSKQAVSAHCRQGGLLFPALVRGKLDRNHPAVREFLASSPEGTPEVRSLRARKLRVQVEHAELDLAKRRGEVISRDLVQRVVIAWIDMSNIRLLQNMPPRLSARVRAAADEADGRRIISEEISQELSRVKQKLLAVCRGEPDNDRISV